MGIDTILHWIGWERLCNVFERVRPSVTWRHDAALYFHGNRFSRHARQTCTSRAVAESKRNFYIFWVESLKVELKFFFIFYFMVNSRRCRCDMKMLFHVKFYELESIAKKKKLSLGFLNLLEMLDSWHDVRCNVASRGPRLFSGESWRVNSF